MTKDKAEEMVAEPEKIEVIDATPAGTDADLANKPEASEKPKKVEVNEDALKQVLARLDSLESENKGLKSEMEAVADKARLQNYRNQNAPKQGRVVRLGVLDGQVILGWTKMPDNICEKDATGKWYEKQSRILQMEDGKEFVGAYSDIAKHTTYLEATITGTRTEVDEAGIEQTILTTIDENGKTRDINSRFVNP